MFSHNLSGGENIRGDLKSTFCVIGRQVTLTLRPLLHRLMQKISACRLCACCTFVHNVLCVGVEQEEYVLGVWKRSHQRICVQREKPFSFGFLKGYMCSLNMTQGSQHTAYMKAESVSWFFLPIVMFQIFHISAYLPPDLLCKLRMLKVTADSKT